MKFKDKKQLTANVERSNGVSWKKYERRKKW